MKKKTLSQIRSKTFSDLEKMIGEKKHELVKTKLEFRVGKIKNIRTMRIMKHDIAQLLTIMKEKKLQEGALS